jgi:hypothetical protein
MVLHPRREQDVHILSDLEEERRKKEEEGASEVSGKKRNEQIFFFLSFVLINGLVIPMTSTDDDFCASPASSLRAELCAACAVIGESGERPCPGLGKREGSAMPRLINLVRRHPSCLLLICCRKGLWLITTLLPT